MPPSTAPDGADQLAELVGRGGVAVLTGAGVSTGSGIPDYRDASGRRRHAGPMTFQRFTASALERQRYWARSHLGWERFARARPNPVHQAVTDLQRGGLVDAVITQNVDGLHQAAGSREVVDLHGRLDRVVCLACGALRPRRELAERLEVANPGLRERLAAVTDAAMRPDGDVVLEERVVTGFRVVACSGCSGILKPDVVFFGEHVPRSRFRGALASLDAASALVVLGSSLAVGSGYRITASAARRGLPVAIVTRGVTRADHLADIRVDGALAPTLAAVVASLGPASARTAATRG